MTSDEFFEELMRMSEDKALEKIFSKGGPFNQMNHKLTRNQPPRDGWTGRQWVKVRAVNMAVAKAAEENKKYADRSAIDEVDIRKLRMVLDAPVDLFLRLI